MSKLVSVCIPTCDRADWLKQSIDSLLAQTYSDLEILVGDNASSDDTAAVCQAYAQQDTRVQHIRREENIGLYPNHNDLLDRAQGEYVGFYHDDDVFDPELIQQQVAFLDAHPEAAMVSPSWRLVDENNNILRDTTASVPEIMSGTEYIDRTLMSGQSCIGLSGTLIRKTALGETRLWEDGPIGFADFAFWFLLAESWQVGHINEALYSYRLHTRSFSRKTVLKVMQDYEAIVERYLRHYKEAFSDRLQKADAWQRSTRRLIFWSLVYELSLDAYRQRPERRPHKDTIFEFMDYSLTEEDRDALHKAILERQTSGMDNCFKGIVGTLIRHNKTRWLGYCVPYARKLRRCILP